MGTILSRVCATETIDDATTKRVIKLATRMSLFGALAESLVVFAGKALAVALESTLHAMHSSEQAAPLTASEPAAAAGLAQCDESVLDEVGLTAAVVYWAILILLVSVLLAYLRRRPAAYLACVQRAGASRVELVLSLLESQTAWRL